MKFLFNFQTQTLKVTSGDHSLILDENHQFHLLGGIGFALDYPEPPQKPQRWIIFKVYPQRIKVIYKDKGIYYQKELFHPPGGVVEVEFSEWDRVNKRG